MKICAYVQDGYAKANYKNECMETRKFAGLRVIIDCLERNGYVVEYAGSATVHAYDVVLVSLTSDCDWWSFIKERSGWRPGNYNVVIGGAGVLHVSPFLRWVITCNQARRKHHCSAYPSDQDRDDLPESVIASQTFSPDRNIPRCAVGLHPHKIDMGGGKIYQEGAMGCNHKCLFCDILGTEVCERHKRYYKMSDSLFAMMAGKLAMPDLHKIEC